MPARMYRIGLASALPHCISLKLIDANADEGDWTAGWAPSDLDGQVVDPYFGAPAARWQSESSGDVPIVDEHLRGTEGHVVYEIEDFHVQIGPDASPQSNFHFGNQDRFRIHWSNPILGPPRDPDIEWLTFGGDSGDYKLDLTWRSAGYNVSALDQGWSVAALGLGAVAPFVGEVDNPFVIYTIKFRNTPGHQFFACSVKRKFKDLDLSIGIRKHFSSSVIGPISLRKLVGL